MNNRVKSLKNLFASRNLDGYLVYGEKNILYFTGFEGGSSLLIPLEGENVLFVHSVNYEAAKEKVENATVKLIKIGEDLNEKVANEITHSNLRTVGFDTMAASTYLKLKNYLKETKLKAAEENVWALRKVKDETELVYAKKAAELTSRGMKIAFEVIEAGLKEREVAAEVEYEMRKLGSDGVAFDTIVSSGSSSAFPHGGCSDRKIKEGDLVVIDVGAKYQGYCADLTRTFIVGKPSSRQMKIYETVKKAQELAISNIKPGIEAKKVDSFAREYIAQKGYGEYFVHNLGHGVGLNIHEPPTLGPMSEDILASGNIVTVEPGIYIPKFGGVRIEDTVLVLEKAEKLTEAPLIFK
ncbi:MAG: Xaa-Pro peptidase family protein [Candidatus Bathyarchaeia archaeon]